MRTLILCLGNEHVSDDGIGAEIGRALQSLPLPEVIQVKVVPRLRLDLLDELAQIDHLVIVDALVANANPGTCTVVEVTQHCAAVVALGCCHTNDVRDLIHLAREVAPAGPECAITIAGVAREQQDCCGAGFSTAVLAAIPRLVDLILMVTGAGLHVRLLASDTFRRNPRSQRAASSHYNDNDSHGSFGGARGQVPGFQ
jgi:hydrogenase maturation protease